VQIKFLLLLLLFVVVVLGGLFGGEQKSYERVKSGEILCLRSNFRIVRKF